MDVDVAIIGAGGAGLSLLLAFDRAYAGAGDKPRIALIDPVRHVTDDRTWCWWTDGPAPLDDLITARWRFLRLVDGHGTAREHDLGGARYVMLRSSALYAEAERAAERLGAVWIQEPVTGLDVSGTTGAPGRVPVTTASARLGARWTFDSRPAPPVRPGRTVLLQHFRGWFVRTPRPEFDPGVATLMDFTVPQPEVGVAFAYLLPTSGTEALVEYTEFSPARLDPAAYDIALRAYLNALGVIDHTVEHVEDGAIPMTDAVFARAAGPRAFRIGTAGGATRGSTGYTFAAMQRQAADVVRLFQAGRTPLPPPAYPARHRWMDAVLLRALRTGGVDGPALFSGLFAAQPPQRVTRFLDGATTYSEELAVMRSTPAWPMARAAAGDASLRAWHRLRSVLPRNHP
ncbi:lycopene cyclase family protein [Spongisporangium articulatum]|uniref:Lycopene cyclase family protein n=1 Tax=Spongisporangium articulatum TaxID=3362603 RepID=A0ABW8AHY0_9ACTN